MNMIDNYGGYGDAVTEMRYSPRYNNTVAMQDYNAMIKFFGKKKKYEKGIVIRARCITNNCNYLKASDCKMYVLKYDGRMKRYKPFVYPKTMNCEATFPISWTFFVEHIYRLAESGIDWKIICENEKITELEFIGHKK